MHATVRSYRADASQMGDGTLVTVSCFESLEQAEASTEMAAEFIRDELSDFEIERLSVVSGDVRVSVETDAVLQEAHV